MKVKKIHADAILPTRAESGSSGYDLYACENAFIPVGKTAVIDTGIAIELPYDNNPILLPYFEIKDRSSLASKGLRTGAGVVDYSYRGPVKVVIHNLNNTNIFDTKTNERGYYINKGDRIAQGIIQLSITTPPEWAESLSETKRDSGGFGSTGK
jgi:dUTP pyrophosphatase